MKPVKPSTRYATLALLLALALPEAQAQPTSPAATDPADASRVFPYEAEILGAVPGRVARLPIPAAVLAEASPNLADVRIHDASGQELPYLIDSATRSSADETQTRVLDANILRTERRIERRESLAPTYVERFEVSPPMIESDRGEGSWSRRRWTLVFSAARPRFVAQVRVTWAAMERQMTLAEGSIYRFPAPERSGLELALEFAPELPEEGTRIVVEIRGEGGYLEPDLRFRTRMRRQEPRRLSIPLDVLSTSREGGVTRVRLERPRGVAPDRLVLSTTTPNFQRSVRVLDERQGRAPTRVGDGLAYRLQEVPGAEELSVPLSRTSGRMLSVEIRDEDSPPLTELHFLAEVTQPVLVFTGAEGPMLLRFGGGRVRAPRYDLMDIRSRLTGRWNAGSAGVQLGEIRPNAHFDAGPALGFALNPGRPQAVLDFTHRASVRVSGATEGLSRVELSPEVMSRAREALNDLRVVDSDGRQWPYLLGAEQVRQIDLPVPSAEVHGGSSTYELTLPAAPLRVSALRLDTDAEYLARNLRVVATLPSGRETNVATLFLGRERGTHDPLVIEFQTLRAQRLRLEIEDGGDAPLVFTHVTLDAPASPLFLVAPDGDYTLYFGDPELDAPVYELTRARALVLSLPAAAAELGAPEPNPAHVPPPWYAGAEGQTWLVWLALLLALLVLVVLTVRVVRSTPEASSAEPASNAEADEAPSESGAEDTSKSSGEVEEEDGQLDADG